MTPSTWWRHAAIYELYVQSFADGDGDGIGDLAGVRTRLPYLAELGVDAIWFSPWYPSPRSDAGYDVADYRSIDPAFGTLADAGGVVPAPVRARAAGLQLGQSGGAAGVRGHPAVLVRPRRRRRPDRLRRAADQGPGAARVRGLVTLFRPRRRARYLPGLAQGR